MPLYCVSGGECMGCMSCMGRALFKCSACDKEIYEGDMYYDINGEPFCERCVSYKEAVSQ
ncbi:MAG: hypothetical protein HFE59_11150 [Clostridiales bacterium]|nr:hypothetical protein [Clostridiales bacterium]